MLQAFIEKGDFCWHCHTGIFAYPMQVALKEQTPDFWGEPSANIPLIIVMIDLKR